MAEGTNSLHPDLEILHRHVVGELSAAEGESLAAHLDACPRCRLELKRLARFDTLDGDAETAADAAWDEAASILDETFAEKILPAVRATAADEGDGDSGVGAGSGGDSPAPGDTGRRPDGESGRVVRLWHWALPVAAVLCLWFWTGQRNTGPLPALDGPDALRGGTASDTTLVLLEPLGEVAAAPTRFAWEARAPYDHYSLEVMTPELESVLRLDDLHATEVVLADSLGSLLASGGRYVWWITGQRGLAPAVVSENGWFVIAGKRPAD